MSLLEVEVRVRVKLDSNTREPTVADAENFVRDSLKRMMDDGFYPEIIIDGFEVTLPSGDPTYTYYSTVPAGQPIPENWDDAVLWQEKQGAVENAEAGGPGGPHQLAEVEVTVTGAKFISTEEE